MTYVNMKDWNWLTGVDVDLSRRHPTVRTHCPPVSRILQVFPTLGGKRISGDVLHENILLVKLNVI
jgi:hypothetical protein